MITADGIREGITSSRKEEPMGFVIGILVIVILVIVIMRLT